MTELRAQHCDEREGLWYCKCGTLLEDADDFNCIECRERLNREKAQRERDHRLEEFRERQSVFVTRTLERLPKWPHLETPESFAAAIKDATIRRVSEGYRLERGSMAALGPSGMGKTSLAARIIHRLVTDGLKAVITDPRDREARKYFDRVIDTRWVTASELVRALREHRLGTGSEPELWSRAYKASVLVVDELGPESPQRAGEIFDLIDRRYTEGRVTLVTSGLTVDQFKERYGDAMFRRLTEKGRGFLIDGHPRGANG